MSETFGSTAFGEKKTKKQTQNNKHNQKKQKTQKKKNQTTTKTKHTEKTRTTYNVVVEVIAACDRAGISRKVVKLVPIGNVKG